MSFLLVNCGSGSFHVYQLCVLGDETKLQETIHNFPCARQVSPVHFQCCIVFTARDPRAQFAAYVVTWPSVPGLHPSTALVGASLMCDITMWHK